MIVIKEQAIFSNADGEAVERLCLDVYGHDVQIIRYDGGPRVLVWVDDAVELMSIDDVDDYIQARI